MKWEPVLAPSQPHPHPVGLTQSAAPGGTSMRARRRELRGRRLTVTRFAAWQRHVPPSTAALVRLLRLLAR